MKKLVNYNYELSEKLFLDLWKKYNYIPEITDKNAINSFLAELVTLSKGRVILDHYSYINFDNITRIEPDGVYTKIIWKDLNKYRQSYLNNNISDDNFMIWQIFGYYTYQYVLMDIAKLTFVKNHNHLFILIQANYKSPRELEKYILNGNHLISKEVNTEELYTEYIFFEGNPDNLIKHSCIFGNLPYYSAIIQPKEKCTASSVTSKKIMLYKTLMEIQTRFTNTYNKLNDVNEDDFDELFSKGNTIRRILEFALKHYCVWANIPIEIENKYGYIELGKLKKALKDDSINIHQSTINVANELSHDSGSQFTKNDIILFYNSAYSIVEDICKKISKDTYHFSNM